MVNTDLTGQINRLIFRGDQAMREVQSSEAKAHLPQLLDEVERGETIIITRHGRPIARLVPETDSRATEIRKTMERIAAFRQTMPRLSVEEILSARHEGHTPSVPRRTL